MATYSITAPNGEEFEITAPDDANEAQVLAYARTQFSMQQKPKPEPTKPTPVSDRGSFVDPLGKGLMLNLSDEAAGLIGATVGSILPESWGGLPSDISFGDAYSGIRQQALQNEAGFRERNPYAAPALELAGGLVTGGAGGARVIGGKALQGAEKYARYAGAGAIPGAISGAGGAEEGDRVFGATLGGILGGVFGAGLPAAWNAGKESVKFIQNALGSNPSYAQRKLVEAMVRDGMSPEMVAARLRRNPGMIIPDAGGANVRSLTRGAAAFPGKSKTEAERFLTNRAYGSGERVKESLYKNLSAEDDVLGAIDVVNRQARERARPLYEQAYAVDIPFDDTLKNLLQKPSMQKAWINAREIAEEEGEVLPQVFKMENGKITGIVEVPNMKVWDYMKRGLDDVVEDTKDSFGRIKGARGKVIDDTRFALNRKLEELNPAWREAKSVWSSKMRYEEALEKGQKFLNEDFDISKRAISRMTDEELEMMRVGVMQALKTKINKMGDQFDVGKRVFGNKDARQKLKAIFPDNKSYRDFQKTVMRENRMAQTKQTVLGGSPTARIEAEKADMLTDPTMLANLAQGNFKAALQAGARYGANKLQVPSGKMADNLSSMLFNQNPAEQQMILQQLQTLTPSQILKLQRNLGGLLGGSMAGISGAVQ